MHSFAVACIVANIVRYFYIEISFYMQNCPSPHRPYQIQKSSRQTKIEWNCDGVRADDETCLVVAEFIELPH